MLDLKSKLVLKILIKECANGSYKIVECSDIIMAMPEKYRVDIDGLKHILTHLDRLDMISIKYDDDEVYCLAIMPNGYEEMEYNTKKSAKSKNKKEGIKFYSILSLIFFIFSFLGTFLAIILYNLFK